MKFILKNIARYFWKEFDKIDAMPANNIDELAAKADAVSLLHAKFDKIPFCIRNQLLSMRRSEV